MATSTPGNTTPHSSSIPFRGESARPGDGVDTLIVWSAIVIGAVFVMVWVFKRGARKGDGRDLFSRLRLGQAKRSIEIRSRIQLTPQVSLHVVRWGGEDILLGCSPQAITVLGREPVPAGNPLGEDRSATVATTE